MSDKMRPISFEGLLQWIVGEYRSQKTIFGIPEAQFFKKVNQKNTYIFNEECSMPLGPAAGPHTQLAQNIITAYLVGSRFFELKKGKILSVWRTNEKNMMAYVGWHLLDY